MNTPIHLSSPSGITAEFNLNGSLRRMNCGEIVLNLFLGNEMEGGLTNIYLRQHGVEEFITPLIGPWAPSVFGSDETGFYAVGRSGDIVFRIRFLLARTEPAWFWHVTLENNGRSGVLCDLVYLQDLGLANYGAIRLNEYYVSQYIDHSPLEEAEHGIVVASRQNQRMGGCFPWTVIGSLRRGISFATDALQVFGFANRRGCLFEGLKGALPGKRLQHEHSLVAIQDEAIALAPGQSARFGFVGYFVSDKKEATGSSDVRWFRRSFELPEANVPIETETPRGSKPCPSFFVSCPLLSALSLSDEEVSVYFGGERRHEEAGPEGLQAFFIGENTHVVLRAKELSVLRPHGHILRTANSLIPDESALTSTVWMGGVFHSMVTQGHVSINRFLSTCHGYLSLFRSHGLRVFVEFNGFWHLLDVASAFEMRPERCRWLYKHQAGLIEVVSEASADCHELRLFLRVAEGNALRFLLAHHVALNGDDGSRSSPAIWQFEGESIFVRADPVSDVGVRFPNGGFLIRPKIGVVEHVGGDELLFGDGLSRDQPYLCLRTLPTCEFALTFEGRLVTTTGGGAQEQRALWDKRMRPVMTFSQSNPLSVAVARLDEMLPWFVQNSMIHYLSPRGLEQYSGGGWGTRDVCQGPVELLLALGQFEPLRDLLARVFRQQNPDGDWPQWFMFFERERNIRPGDSHGDIVFWPLLALAQYLVATGDESFLNEKLPYYHPDGEKAAEHATVWQHVSCALELIRRRVIPDTHLAAYGHGDWNDALQPAEPEWRDRLCSAWTVTLNYQTLISLAEGLETIGREGDALALRREAETVKDEFQQLLISDDVVAGLVYFHKDGSRDLLLHPADQQTGLRYSLLPIIHAVINDMFTRAQAAKHFDIIRNHLTGPDGARLFDKPLAYRGGIQRFFQRAESASFFGREIGLMYTHAHLRYCEALARYGDATTFFHALQQAVPIGIKAVISSAAPRQSNSYYSSSDAVFADRYEAFTNYDAAMRGDVPLEGGWRVYSSGPGIAARLIVQSFLGIRIGRRDVGFDPVIPHELTGLCADFGFENHPSRVHYHVGPRGCGVKSVELNGSVLALTREKNPYRPGGVRVRKNQFISKLRSQGNTLVIRIG